MLYIYIYTYIFNVTYIIINNKYLLIDWVYFLNTTIICDILVSVGKK